MNLIWDWIILSGAILAFVGLIVLVAQGKGGPDGDV